MKVSFGRWLPAITEQNPRLDSAVRGLARTLKAQSRQVVAASTRIGQTAANQRVNGQSVGNIVARTDVRKGALALAGLAFIGGVAVGPGVAAHTVAGDRPVSVTGAGGSMAHSGGGTAEASAVPSLDQLLPRGTQGAQSNIQLSPQQLDNAKTIVHTAKKLGLPDRAAVIGVATSLQESKLNNYGDLGGLNDHDSLGLFQQRPSSGWGTPEQLTNPEYAATAFFNGLQRVDGWQAMPLSQAAQTVQVSAFPFAYAQWEQQAANVVQSVDRGH